MIMDEIPNVEVCPAWDNGNLSVFILLHEWAVNGSSIQSWELTPAQARAVAAELLEAADDKEVTA